MASVSPPFEVEDQGDGEFFDKLVDEADSVLKDKEFNEAKSLSNSSKNSVSIVGENVEAVGKGNEDEKLDSGLNNSLVCADVDCKTSENNGRKGGCVKQVDWSAFSISSGVGSESCSEFFNELDDGFDNFLGNVGDHSGVSSENVGGACDSTAGYLSSVDSAQHQVGQECVLGSEQASDGQDKTIEYWESLYPGWKYDANTGQWYQVDGYNETTSTLQNYDNNATFGGDRVGTLQQSNLSYFHDTGQSVAGSVADGYTGIYNYNQGSLANGGYPSHMLFDPQYPGWYYDAIAQEWRLLESYTASIMPQKVADHDQHSHKGNSSTVEYLPGQNNGSLSNFHQTETSVSQGLTRDQGMGWGGTVGDRNQHSFNVSRPEPVTTSEAINFSEYDMYKSSDQQNQELWYKSSGTASSSEQASPNFGSTNRVVGMQNLTSDGNFSPHHNQHKNETSPQIQFSNAYNDNQKSLTYSHQPAQIGSQLFSASAERRSSDGRPPHALVTFGFGGKLIFMKDNGCLSTNSPYGSQDSNGGVISIINLIELFLDKGKSSWIGCSARDYFHSLCQQSFSGPLVGVSVANKELNKWIDDKIANCGLQDMDYRRGELLRLLFSLLKIACQYKGKLRSPFGTDCTLKESDSPESAVADLFASAKRNVSKYGALGHCLQNFPSEGRIQATAVEVQKLLVSGRIKEALQFAQQGQLWGPAIVLASQLGDQFFGDTVKQMALCQLEEGSPLRTLCLLISGKPADVFCSSDNASNVPGATQTSQQCAQTGALAMLQEWEENLAIITANRTKDDELVIIHLGDCLWKEKAEVIGAHICYLVAEATFESYSDSARICLIGADHWRCPRTYASPEAIQRTELYEYSKVLGNPQFLLLPFQPYKLIYAFMLAEVGKLSESLRYCQAILKCLKIGRAPEIDTWKNLVSSLEERLRIHQQGGYSATMAPSKFVGKLLNLFDSTAHRVVGGLPPPVPSTPHSVAQHKHDRQKLGPLVSNSQPTVSKSSLAPSASMEPISEWTVSRTPRHNRSISEPDIGKTPRKEASADMHDKESGLGGYSRFGRFGSQLFQKTVGRVLKSRPERQAKLGEKNKFYYDENLKRWVEEGADVSSEEVVLQPPPTTAAILNKNSEILRDKLQTEIPHGNGGTESPSPTSSESSSGFPPMPHHFSARGRMGVRSRYVDTFNKGGGSPANTFHSPIISPKPGGSPAKFFIPSPVSTTNGSPTSTCSNDSPMSFTDERKMQRMPSMDNITIKRTGLMAKRNSPLAPHSRRTVSWSGSFSEVSDPNNINGFQTLGEALNTPPPAFSPSEF